LTKKEGVPIILLNFQQILLIVTYRYYVYYGYTFMFAAIVRPGA